MALINCPECGSEVSDKAKACPRCGYAIADNRPDGCIKIKITDIYGYPQKVLITSGEKVLWEGHAGQTADFYLEKATNVHIKYHLGITGYPMECDEHIDPIKGKRYQIKTSPGFFKPKIHLTQVDFVDSD